MNSNSYQVIFELFGTARSVAGVREVAVSLTGSATVREALTALTARYPALIDRVIKRDMSGLIEAYTLNLNGTRFVTDLNTEVRSGDRILLLFASAGG